MAWYTTQLKTICEVSSGLPEDSSYKEVIPKAIPKVFDFDFPLFDANYKNVLCTKILKRYYTREIAHETVGLWKLRLDTVLNEIMPYYNQLYESALLDFNPFHDVDLTREYTKTGKNDKIENGRGSGTTTNDGEIDKTFSSNQSTVADKSNLVNDTTENNSIRTGEINANNEVNKNTHTEGVSDKEQESTGSNTDKISDTPQGGLSGLLADEYLTKAQIASTTNTGNENQTNSSDTTENFSDTGLTTSNESVSDDGKRTSQSVGRDDVRGNQSGNDKTKKSNLTTFENSNSGNTNITTLDDYIETVKGKQGSENYSSLLLKFRETFLNVDTMILDDLAPLFFGLWDFQGGIENGWI